MQDPLISPKAGNKYSTCTLRVHSGPVGPGDSRTQSLQEARGKGLRGQEWGAGQCEMEEVDATLHTTVGPSEKQSGLIKGRRERAAVGTASISRNPGNTIPHVLWR